MFHLCVLRRCQYSGSYTNPEDKVCGERSEQEALPSDVLCFAYDDKISLEAGRTGNSISWMQPQDPEARIERAAQLDCSLWV